MQRSTAARDIQSLTLGGMRSRWWIHGRLPSSRRAIAYSCLTVCATVLASLIPSKPAYVWNFTPSMPVGLYRFEDRVWRIGDPVAFHPTGRADEILKAYAALPQNRLLLKRVAAGAGDVVCRDGGAITINGDQVAEARRSTSDGVAIPQWEECRMLALSEVFLLGDHPASLDGRYFGPVSASGIVGVISPLVTFPDQGGLQQ